MIRANTTGQLGVGPSDEPLQEASIWERMGEWLFKDKEVAAAEARVASLAVELNALLGTIADMDGAHGAERARLQASEDQWSKTVAEMTHKNAQLRMDVKRLGAQAKEQEGHLQQERKRRDALEQQLAQARVAAERRRSSTPADAPRERRGSDSADDTPSAAPRQTPKTGVVCDLEDLDIDVMPGQRQSSGCGCVVS